MLDTNLKKSLYFLKFASTASSVTLLVTGFGLDAFTITADVARAPKESKDVLHEITLSINSSKNEQFERAQRQKLRLRIKIAIAQCVVRLIAKIKILWKIR